MMRFASYIYICIYSYIIHMHIFDRSTLYRNISKLFKQRTTTNVVLQTNEKTTTVLIIVNNSTFILFWLISSLRTSNLDRVLPTINFFVSMNRLNERTNISSYTEKFAPIRRVLKFTSGYLSLYICICVCASFFPN